VPNCFKWNAALDAVTTRRVPCWLTEHGGVLLVDQILRSCPDRPPTPGHGRAALPFKALMELRVVVWLDSDGLTISSCCDEHRRKVFREPWSAHNARRLPSYPGSRSGVRALFTGRLWRPLAVTRYVWVKTFGHGQLPSRSNCKGPLGLPCAVTPRRDTAVSIIANQENPRRMIRRVSVQLWTSVRRAKRSGLPCSSLPVALRS